MLVLNLKNCEKIRMAKIANVKTANEKLSLLAKALKVGFTSNKF